MGRGAAAAAAVSGTPPPRGPSPCLIPRSREGGDSCQRKWGRIKEGRKGQGQVGGRRPESQKLHTHPTLC